MNIVTLRLAALAIAIMAVVDPALTTTRVSRPMVSIIPSPAADPVLVDRVAHTLEPRFTVIRGWLAGAAGAVVLGSHLPDESVRWNGTVVGVVPASRPVQVIAIDAPREAPLNARVPVRVRVAVTGAVGRSLAVSLRVAGVVVDTDTVAIERDTVVVPLGLTLVPGAVGPAQLTVFARLSGTTVSDSASTVVETRGSRYSVLFFDPRPSWNSLFVRRTIERDARFVVTSRVQTSRGVANVGGSAPVSLGDAAITGYATIVIGSPDALSANDVAALDRFMRTRGGRVALLLDGRVNAGLNRLTGTSRWSAIRLQNAALLDDSSGSSGIRARELVWPTVSTPGTSVHALSRSSDSSIRPVIWSAPVGAGRLLVSGALDAWHYRDAGASAFETFWPEILAGLSASAPRGIEIELDRRVLQPAQHASIRVTVRDGALSMNHVVSVRATMTNGSDSGFVRLWPTAEQGIMSGMLVAPKSAGPWRVIVRSGSEAESTSFVVDTVAREAMSDESSVISAFASSRGGFLMDEAQLPDLPDRLAAAFQPVSRVETWYPMRSAWWLFPFTALLGAEWWWRRRRGLA